MNGQKQEWMKSGSNGVKQLLPVNNNIHNETEP